MQQITVSPDLKVLPVPGNRTYKFHLVYEVIVINRGTKGVPGKYYTLLDASTGKVLYRDNHVRHIANTDMN